MPLDALSASPRYKGRPRFAFGPEQENRQCADAQKHGVENPVFGDKGVKGEDIHDDGAEDEKPEISRAGDGDQNAAEEFQHFDKSQIAGRPESGKKRRGGTALREFRFGRQSEEHDRGGHDEKKPEQDSGDGREKFHGRQ